MAIVQVWSVKSKSHIYELNKQGERGGNRLRCCYLANASLRFTVIVFIGTMPFRVTWYPFVLLTALLSMGWNPPFRFGPLNHRSCHTYKIYIGSTQALLLLVSCTTGSASPLFFIRQMSLIYLIYCMPSPMINLIEPVSNIDPGVVNTDKYRTFLLPF